MTNYSEPIGNYLSKLQNTDDLANQPIGDYIEKQNKIEIRLTMGKWFVSNSEEHELIAPCLGSCVAVCIYETKAKIIGMAHIVFPSRQMVSHPNEEFPSARYADEVIELLVQEISKIASSKNLNLVAKLAGGAQMFKGVYNNKGFPLIGQGNVQTLKKELIKRNIPLKAADVGGTCGRTVSFDLSKGLMLVRRIGETEYSSI